MLTLIFLFIMLGIPTGMIMLIAEILISYSRNKETREKLENLIPKRDTSRDTSFPDLQNTIGGKRQDVKEGKQYDYEYTYSESGKTVSQSGSTAAKTGKKESKPFKVPEAYARPVRHSRRVSGAAVACFVVSGATFFTAASDVFGSIAEYGFSNVTEFAGSIPMLLISIACLIAGLWLVISKQRKMDKENRYIAIINQGYGMIPIDNISYLYPKKYDDCVQELQEMINKGTLPDAYIDYGRRLLVIDPNNSSVEPLIAPQGKVGSPSEPAAAGAHTAKRAAKKTGQEKIDFLSLERLSKEVTDEDIKLKLIRISTTLKTIGQKAEEDPEIKKAAGVDTFMDMYLPKTINLVRQYEQVNREAKLPDDNELKNNILETLDAIDTAALTLWKDIIHSDMIDISAELDALQTKLIMDGYSESELKADQGKGAEEAEEAEPELHPEAAGPDVFDQLRKQREKAPEKTR